MNEISLSSTCIIKGYNSAVRNMAFYDDRKFLLSHIHHSFITSDDTGVCEEVMLNEVVTDKPLYPSPDILQPSERKVLDYYANILDSELMEPSQSYDIVSDMEHIGAHRLRSNTAQRLDRLKKERQVQARIKNVQWKDNTNDVEESELLQLFPKKDLSKNEEKPPEEKRKSALTEALEQLPITPTNPFLEYTRFDGRMSRVAQTKKILIFLTMLESGERDFPMEVISFANARVYDLIGLICWQYTNEDREPKLKPYVSNYCLRIAEETGEVDEDFPSLDPKELVAKFGFPVLALVERKDSTAVSIPLITVHIGDEFSKLEVPSLEITLKEAVDHIRKHRKWLKKSSTFHIEKLHEHGIPLSLDARVIDLGTTDFRLILRESHAKDTLLDDWNKQQIAYIEAPMYQSFTVSFNQKMGRNYDVQLGISEEKLEINPLPQKGAAKLLSRQQKPSTYHMDSIACCEIISRKYSPGRSVFKIAYKSGQDFKSLIFESDIPTVQEIVKKMQMILDMKFNNICREYQSYREQKLKRKQHAKPSHSHSFS